MELPNQKRFLVQWISIKTNQKVGIPPKDTFSMKKLEISVQQQIPTWN
jgi:lipid-A-disaccharide synthase-like uncharacterized protein